MRFLFLLVLLFPSCSFADVIAQNSTWNNTVIGTKVINFEGDSQSTVGSASSLTYDSPDVANGENRIGIVVVGIYDTSPLAVSDVTWDGTSMTNVTSQITGSGVNEIWYLVNPPAGVTSIVVTGGSAWTVCFSATHYYSGVYQTSPIDAFVENTGAGSKNFAGPLDTNTKNTMLVDIALKLANDGGMNITKPGVRISRGQSGSGVSYATSYQRANNTGTNTMNETSTFTQAWNQTMLSLRNAQQ